MRGLAVAVAFLTRVPWFASGEVGPLELTRASRWYPWVGAGIGCWVAVCFLLARTVFPPLLAATLGIAAGILATGALHEDALGDVADGFGGGLDRERKLEIMKDSRQGSYGVLAMLVSLLLRIQALAWLPEGLALPALIAIHALSRVGMVWMLWLLPSARAGGMAASLGGIGPWDVGWATAGGIFLAIALLGSGASVLVGATLLATVLVSWVSLRHIAGVTGDVLGSAQQLAEIGSLLALVAIAHNPGLAVHLTAPWLGHVGNLLQSCCR